MEKQQNDLRKGKPGENAGTNARMAGHADQAMPTTPRTNTPSILSPGSTAGMAEGQVTKSN